MGRVGTVIVCILIVSAIFLFPTEAQAPAAGGTVNTPITPTTKPAGKTQPTIAPTALPVGQQNRIIRVMDRENRNIFTVYGLTPDHAGLYINQDKTQTLPRTRALFFDKGIDFSKVDQQYAEFERWVVATAPTTTETKIEAELIKRSSPMKGLGKYIFDLGKAYGVDPNFFMAIAYLESHYASINSVALRNKNPGSLRNGRGGATKEKNGFALFDTYEEGIRAFYIHLSTFYFTQKGLITVDDILKMYAPPSENDTLGYIRNTKYQMDYLREDTRATYIK